MKKVASRDPNLIIFKSGGGWLLLIGIPILLFGLFFLVAAGAHIIAVVFYPEAEKLDEMLFQITSFGLIFTCVGLAISFKRIGVTIDKKKGLVTSWWGVFRAWRKKTYRLSSFTRVSITKEIRHSQNTNRTVYPVRLQGVEGEIKFGEPRNYKKSRLTAEQIAESVFLPLVDSSSGVEVVRNADKLDESIRKQSQRMGKVKKIPEPSANIKTNYSIDGKQIEMQIPSFRGTRLLVFFVIIVIVFFAFLYFFIFDEFLHFNASNLLQVVPLSALVILDIIIFFIILKFVSKRILVRVSTDELAITEIWSFGRNTKKIPVDELEELVIIGTSGKGQGIMKVLLGSSFAGKIMARSDSTTLVFGLGLSAEELEWMHDVIENWVS